MEKDGEKDVIGEGTVVRDRKWGGTCSGTVVRREGDSLFVAWHNSFVEDELTVSDVTVWPDAPEHLRAWRGAVGVWNPARADFSIEPLRQQEGSGL